ncbi:MAG TPA: ABC transporter permease [Terriglobales bacterium]|jgi:ABC-type antimicrobial peptide transport system permease subunit|nr:ABC transporter permease [Terriglobales bacterium]
MPLLTTSKRQSLRENVIMALDTLRNNKLRSALTLLSIMVAVATLIVVVALLMGLDRNIQDQVQGYGTNTAFFSHLPTGPHFGRLSKEERMRKPLTYDDFLVVRDVCTACIHVTVSIFRNDAPNWIRYKGEEVTGLDFRGATAEFFSVYANAVIKEGRSFTEVENQHHMAYVVLGEDSAGGLFPAGGAVGKTITINGSSFEVIGTFEKPRGGLGGPDNSDRRVVIPYWTFRKIYPLAKEHGIRIEAYPGRLDVAVDQTRVALRRTRKLMYDKADDFSFQTAESAIREFHNIVGMVALAIIVIASVGMMIGGVGVMNIMLVSVTERTREIGVRKAMGARRQDIIWQFLTEAMVMAGTGGLVGILLGYAISGTIKMVVPTLPTFVPIWAVLSSFMVATSVGLFFGMYPAVKAARLDPVVALRYE